MNQISLTILNQSSQIPPRFRTWSLSFSLFPNNHIIKIQSCHLLSFVIKYVSFSNFDRIKIYAKKKKNTQTRTERSSQMQHQEDSFKPNESGSIVIFWNWLDFVYLASQLCWCNLRMLIDVLCVVLFLYSNMYDIERF